MSSMTSPDKQAVPEDNQGIPDRWMHGAEWAKVGPFTIYPRESSYFIGRVSGAREYCDIDLGFDGGFENIEAAIDHARWLAGGAS